MIKNFLITGDIHGQLALFSNIDEFRYPPAETGIIILGDAGFNYYLDQLDIRMKRRASEIGYTFYCIRGNHEARPSDISSMKYVYDEEIKGMVYYEPAFPNIIYLIDGDVYEFNSRKVLVLGGAYSVDKDYRKARGWAWWANEQLSPEEQCKILRDIQGKSYDLVFSHTCPLSWEPTEMFLSFIDQSKVDKSTETWLEEVKNNIQYNHWLFGHFHGDKIVNDKTIMLFEKIVDITKLSDIINHPEKYEGFIDGR